MGRSSAGLEPVTHEIFFDEEGFTSGEYNATTEDTLRFTNQSSSNLVVYILTDDGQSAATQSLSLSQSQVSVGANSYVDRGVGSAGDYLLSLNAAPQDPPPSPNTGGTVVVIIVSN